MFVANKWIILLVLLFKVCLADKGEYIGCYNKEFVERLERFDGTVDSCLDACEEIFYRYSILNQDQCKCANSIKAPKLNQTDCTASCRLDPDKFCGGLDAESYYATGLKVPSPPRNLRSVIANRTETSLLLQWDPPEVQNTLTHYLIESEIVKTYTKEQLFKPTWSFDNVTRQAELVNLHPGSTYTFVLKTISNYGEGGNATITEHTVIGVPDPMPESPKIISKTGTTIKIEIKPADNINGPIDWYEIIVNYVEDEISENFNASSLQNYKDSQDSGQPYYITAKLNYENRTKLFTVGDGSTYQGYLNVPLDPERHAHITLGVVSRFEDIEKRRYSVHSHDEEVIQTFSNAARPPSINAVEEDTGSDTLVTVLTVAVVIFSLILIGTILAFFYIRHKIGNAQGLHRLSDVHEMALQGPIVEMVNNGFVHEPVEQGNFQQRLAAVYGKLDTEQKLSRNLLTLDIDHIIGSGNFGDVIKGNLTQGSVSYSCQVHLISDDMDKENESLFFRGCNNMLNAMPHKNLLSLYGICKTNDWVYVVLEDVSYTLKKHLLLLRERSIWKSGYRSLEENILSIIIELIDTMEYLESKNILHKQLCAHNIKVTSDYGLKLSIFGPPLHDDQGKSIDLSRWHAPEVLKYRNHTIKSDIWSFGCIMWEICCLGGTLYSNLNSPDLMGRIKNGARPEQPNFMSDDLYQMLLNCWELDQNERPLYKDIKILLQQFLTMPGHALTYELDVNGGVTTILPYYLPLLEIVN